MKTYPISPVLERSYQGAGIAEMAKVQNVV
jgi:hypothetical protein